MKKVAVVGGGITGLSAAYALKKAGIDPLLFEAGEHTGGVIRSHSSNGYLVEDGPNTMLESPPELTELIEELGLSGEVVPANPEAARRYIVRNGALAPLPSSPPGILTTRALSLSGKFRLLKEPWIPPPSGNTDDESIAGFTRRRLGQDALDYLVDPFISGIFAGDPERISLRHAFPRIHEMEQNHGSLVRGMRASRRKGRGSTRSISFRNGLGTLTERLSTALGKRTYFETTAESITPLDGKWKLIVGRYGRQLREHFDAIVLALPAPALARLQLENEYATALQTYSEIDYAPVASLALGFSRSQVTHPLDGFGALVPSVEKRNILGVLFSSTLFPGRAPEGKILLTVFIGGTKHREILDRDDAALAQTGIDEVRSLLSIRGEPSFQRLVRWQAAIPQYNLGHRRFLESCDAFEDAHPGLFIAGNFRDGVSLGNCVAAGLKHGRRAAEHLQRGEA